jgi:tetratricopeptide (TPR) repeat protein
VTSISKKRLTLKGVMLVVALATSVSNALSLIAAPLPRFEPDPRTQSPRNSQSAAQSSSAQAHSTDSAREKRAQAYAKLLEGQRYYAAARSRGASQAGELQRAQQAFREAAELDPTLAEAHTALAEIAFVLQDLPQAEREAEVATRINPNNLGAFRILSRTHTISSNLVDGKPDAAIAAKAVAALREVIRIKPSDAEAWALLSEFHLAAGREAEAIEALKMWATLPAPMDDRLFKFVSRGRDLTPDAANARLAEVYLGKGNTAEALAAIRRAMAISPENPAYLSMLGRALESSETSDESILQELRFIVARDPRNSVAVGVLARAEARAGRTDKAIATLREGIAARTTTDREQMALRLQLAEVFAEAYRYDEAVGVYEDVLKERKIGTSPPTSARDKQLVYQILPVIVVLQHQAGQEEKALATIERLRGLLDLSDPVAETLVVGLFRSLGKRTEALAAVRSARERHPTELRLVRLEAMTLGDLGRVDEALEIMRAQLKGAPSDYDEYVVIASVLMNAGRGDQAVEAARKALELVPLDEADQNTNALLLLSSAQERAGDAKGSEETLRKILQKNPRNASALNNLGYFLTERNERLPEALEMIQQAVRTEPSNPSFLDSLGWIYFKLGKLSEAERYLRDAARRNPASGPIHDHLGDLFNQLGKRDQALAAWRKALSLSVEVDDSARIKAKIEAFIK